MANIPVSFSTSFGTLESSQAITNDSGYASVLLYSGISRNDNVKAYAVGGTTAFVVTVKVRDEDLVEADKEWLTNEIVLKEASLKIFHCLILVAIRLM